MNTQLLAALGIDAKMDLQQILTELEDKQFEYLERLETVSDDNRKKELAEVLKQIEDEIQATKEQIKVVSSAVILDTAGENADRNPKQQKSEKKSSSDVSGQVERLKEKEAEKKAKEEEKKRKMAEEAAKKQQAANSASNSTTNSASTVAPKATQSSQGSAVPVKNVSSVGSEFNNALAEYKKQNYAGAFPVFKKLSEAGDASAQYLVAMMYLNGLGVQKDKERAMFWLGKSADGGELAGRYMYGKMLMSSHHGDAKTIATAFKHLEIAADNGDDDAKVTYINSALSNLGGKKEIKKAIGYCDVLKVITVDSYNKQKIDQSKQALIQMKKGAGSSSSSRSSSYGRKKSKFPWFLLILIVCIIFVANRCSKEQKAERILREGNRYTEAIEVTEDALMKVQIIAEVGNIRDGVGTEANIISSAVSGTVFYATGNTGTASNGGLWYEIYIDEQCSQVGWISDSIMVIIE